LWHPSRSVAHARWPFFLSFTTLRAGNTRPPWERRCAKRPSFECAGHARTFSSSHTWIPCPWAQHDPSRGCSHRVRDLFRAACRLQERGANDGSSRVGRFNRAAAQARARTPMLQCWSPREERLFRGYVSVSGRGAPFPEERAVVWWWQTVARSSPIGGHRPCSRACLRACLRVVVGGRRATRVILGSPSRGRFRL